MKKWIVLLMMCSCTNAEVNFMDYMKTYLPEKAVTLSASEEIARKVLASVCGAILGGTSDTYPVDVIQSDWFAQGGAVSCKYRLFGSYSNTFKLNPDSGITRLDAARLAVRLYAAITGIDEYRVDPGLPCGITDLTAISVEKQWYVYSAIYNGFMDEASKGKFEPARNLTCIEAAKLIYSVVERCKREGNEHAATTEKYNRNFRTVPAVDKPVAENIDIIGYSDLPGDMKRLACSIQGIVNREEVKIMTDKYPEYMFNYLIEKGYIQGKGQTFMNVMDVVEKYIRYVKGAVVVDPDNRYTINTAETIAGVERRIIITPEMIEKVKGLGITDIKDLRDYNLKTLYEAQKWVYENYWMFTRRDAMHLACFTPQYDYDRDYYIQLRIPSFYIPRQGECEDELLQYGLVEMLMKQMPPNIPILGFPPATDGTTPYGLDEYCGVLFLSQYGKYILPQDWIGNLSFFSAVKVPESTRKFTPKAGKLTCDPHVKYICLTMMDSGDAPAYIQYGLNQFQWSDKARGTAPFSICYGFANYDLLPTYTEYFFSSATATDYFFSALSGIGYMMPFANNFGASYRNIKKRSEGFASIPPVDDDNNPYMSTDAICKDHYNKVNIMMGKTGMTSQIMYSRGSGFWYEDDYNFTNTYLANLSNMTSIMADVFRVVPLEQVKPSVYTLDDGKPVFHCMTFYDPYDKRLFVSGRSPDFIRDNDEYAVDWFVNEIVTSTDAGGTMNLYNCAIFSWQINFNRISMIIEKMNRQYPGKYQFVTIQQLEDLYHQTNN